MSTTRPTWADALKHLLTGLAEQAPKPLLDMLGIFSDVSVADADFAAFVSTADEDDPAFVQVRLAFAKWDKSEEFDPLGADGQPTKPQSIARRRAVYAALRLKSIAQDAIEARVPPFERTSVVISKVFEPWYAEARPLRTQAYWHDYSSYLRDKKGWSAESLAALDGATTQIVERLADPTRESAKQTRGLVVGYVQSGKTANFTGVVSKAIDAGYRLIIVLTGTIEILRAQTQRRLDMELMGVENILAGQDPTDPAVLKELDYQQDLDWIAGKFVSHGAALDQHGVARIDRVTTHHGDYKRLPQGLTRLKFFRYEKAKPFNAPENLFRSDAYVAVIKKNPAALTKLIQDLKPIREGLAELPVLIIDDESDQASPDTTNPSRWESKPEDRKRTTINGKITELMGLCPRAQYVGYTATPFANVFIDPNDDMDLFPSDFVLSLDRTPGYMGVREFHDVGTSWEHTDRNVATSNELAHVRALIADPVEDPAGRDAELRAAIDAWVLSGAIKRFRQSASTAKFRHHTMLVHESVKTGDHRETADVVRAVWKSGKFTTTVGLGRLRQLFDDDYMPVMGARADGQPVPASFDILKPFIGETVAQMTIDGDPILVINSDKEIKAAQKKLDFEVDDVWRILVGGTQLSRGFTVEGLTISYFRRKAGQADTLMQAGRWFGYRKGYQDLVRLYIRRDEKVDLYEAFEALLLDEEEFREELRQYEGMDQEGVPLVEPRQIPPLVSQHLPWLKPTAANKMWNAVVDSKATAGSILDKYSLPRFGDSGYASNLSEVGIPLAQTTTRVVTLNGGKGDFNARIGLTSAESFLASLSTMTWDPTAREAQAPFLKFLASATASGRIKDWLVAWPQPVKNAVWVDVPGLGNVPVIRRRRRANRPDFSGADQGHRHALEEVIRGEEVSGLQLDATAGRGVALLYLCHDLGDPGETAPEFSLDRVVPLLSIGAPASATPARRDLIRWTVRVDAKPDHVVVDNAA